MTTPNLGYARLLDNAQESYAPVTTGRALAIDVERAREVVGRLRAVADAVSEQYRALTFVAVTAPGADEVSRNAAKQATRMVMAGRNYLRSWHNDLVAGISALDRQIADYEFTDKRNSVRL